MQRSSAKGLQERDARRNSPRWGFTPQSPGDTPPRTPRTPAGRVRSKAGPKPPRSAPRRPKPSSPKLRPFSPLSAAKEGTEPLSLWRDRAVGEALTGLCVGPRDHEHLLPSNFQVSPLGMSVAGGGRGCLGRWGANAGQSYAPLGSDHPL